MGDKLTGTALSSLGALATAPHLRKEYALVKEDHQNLGTHPSQELTEERIRCLKDRTGSETCSLSPFKLQLSHDIEMRLTT
jgi:hypothetical protein